MAGVDKISAVSPYPCCAKRVTIFRTSPDEGEVVDRTCPECGALYEVVTRFDGEKVVCAWHTVVRTVEPVPFTTTTAWP